LVAAVAVGVVGAATLTTGVTHATFTEATSSAVALTAGSVVVSDDDGGSAVLDVQGLLPGATGQKCLTVTFTGSVRARVPFWVSASSGSLAPYVNLTVLEGRGGSAASCTGFVADRVAFTGTLGQLAARLTGPATGGGTFAPTTSGQTRTYQFVYTLAGTVPAAQQGQAASITLRWDSQQADVVVPAGTGANDDGQLGVGDTAQHLTLTSVAPTTTTWSQVSAGAERSCGVQGDGSLWCWGRGDQGYVGDGGRTDRTSPVRIGSATTWADVSVGMGNTCALSTSGTLSCWGLGWGGNGDGTNTFRDTPVPVVDAGPWRAVSVGHSTTCGIKVTGTLWCWGANANGQVGNGTNQAVYAPVQVGDPSWTWSSVSAGGWHACAVRSDHTLWCWGFNAGNGVGDGSGTDQWSPVQIGTARLWAVAGLGSYQSCAVALDGSLWCWGGWGLGFGSTPGRIGTGTAWATVTGGDDFYCGTQQDRTLWCARGNGYGQLGTGDTASQPAPVQVATGIAQVAAGRISGEHTIALPWPAATP
ncbi:MAG TPA: hypothetical protein VE781_12500, partial [Kineosporiaceae bacterium]|nr:hypothetical protein [Kineosporiaceae bacterium]